MSAMRTATKKVRSALAEKKQEEAAKHFVAVQSLLGKLAKKGVVAKNTAARKTARLAAQMAKLSH